MKKGLFAFAAALAFAACNQAKDASTTRGNGDDRNAKNVENTKAVYHAVETNDVSKMDSLMSEDAVDH